MYLMFACFPGVIKGLWAARNHDKKNKTFLFPSILRASIVLARRCSDAHLRLREPQQAWGAELPPSSCSSSSSTGFCRHTRRTVAPALRSGRYRLGGLCCYESSPRRFSGSAPPLRIHDSIVFVTTSYGRFWVPQRITGSGKQLWCSVSVSVSSHPLL